MGLIISISIINHPHHNQHPRLQEVGVRAMSMITTMMKVTVMMRMAMRMIMAMVMGDDGDGDGDG